MYPFVRNCYRALTIDQRKELCSASYRICTSLNPWTASSKSKVLELLKQVTALCPFIKKDLVGVEEEISKTNPLLRVPVSVLNCVKDYFSQFYVVRDRTLCLPKLEGNDKVAETKANPSSSAPSSSSRKIKAITEETWWVVRVKNEYRMCRLTFDRGEYWEMVEYQGKKVHNPQYRFPKYDNRVIYEFKEHLTPDMFADKITEAVKIRREALRAQANRMLDQFEVVLIARHTEKGTLVGGVEREDENYWYLDTYTEDGEHLFFGENIWKLDKKSRCTVLQTVRRK